MTSAAEYAKLAMKRSRAVLLGLEKRCEVTSLHPTRASRLLNPPLSDQTRHQNDEIATMLETFQIWACQEDTSESCRSCGSSETSLPL